MSVPYKDGLWNAPAPQQWSLRGENSEPEAAEEGSGDSERTLQWQVLLLQGCAPEVSGSQTCMFIWILSGTSFKIDYI